MGSPLASCCHQIPARPRGEVADDRGLKVHGWPHHPHSTAVQPGEATDGIGLIDVGPLILMIGSISYTDPAAVSPLDPMTPGMRRSRRSPSSLQVNNRRRGSRALAPRTRDHNSALSPRSLRDP